MDFKKILSEKYQYVKEHDCWIEKGYTIDYFKNMDSITFRLLRHRSCWIIKDCKTEECIIEFINEVNKFINK